MRSSIIRTSSSLHDGCIASERGVWLGPRPFGDVDARA